MGKRGRVMEMGQRGGVAYRGGGSDRMDGPIFTCGGQKTGQIPWEQAIPAPGHITQSRVLALGR